MDYLGAIDRNFCCIDTPKTRQVIGLSCKLDRLPDRETLLADLNRAVSKYPRLKSCFKKRFRHQLKADTFFQIENHLRINLNHPGDTFEEVVAIIFSNPISGSSPNWSFEVFSFTDCSGKEQFGAALFVHHALADGLGVLRVFLEIVNGHQAFPAVPAAKVFTTLEGDRSRYSPLFRSVRQLFHEYFYIPARTALNGKNSSARELIVADVSLEKFSRFAKEAGGSLNDLYLGIVSLVVDRYQELNQKEAVSTRAIMPINLRVSEDFSLGNNLTGVGVMLPTGDLTLKQRVAKVRHEVKSLRAKGAIGAYYLLAHISSFLPGVLQRLACEAAARRTNFICTNVPGPTTRLKLAGAEILQYYGLPALMLQHGAAFCLFSSEGRAFFSVVIDPGIVTDRKLLRDCLEFALKEVTAA